MLWVIHIGAPKTGSTAIQRFLFENRSALLAERILYPEVNIRGYGHHDLAFLLHGGYPRWATPQPRTLADLANDLRSSIKYTPVATTVVLSSENFYLFPRPVELLKFLNSAGFSPLDEVKIVCYVRRQDDAHISWYNQTVKAQGNSASLQNAISQNRDLWDYSARLEPWQMLFGVRAITVRDYTPFSGGGGDVRLDFLEILGVASGAFSITPETVNSRINRDILNFQRVLNRLPLPFRQKRRYHKQLMRLTAATAGSSIFDDTPLMAMRERAALVDSYALSNALLARTFLGRDDMFEPVRIPAEPCSPPQRHGLTIKKTFLILKGILNDGCGQ